MNIKNQDYIENIKKILEQGGDINSVDEEGYTPLMRVIVAIPQLFKDDSASKAKEHEALVNLCFELLKRGASIAGDMGVRCLCLATKSQKLCEEFVRRGVSINGKKIESLPPEQCYPIVSAAAVHHKLEVFVWFREQGAELSPVRGADCLICAMNTPMLSHFKIWLIEGLLGQGINPDQPDESGQYPISIAAEKNEDWYNLLVEAGASKAHVNPNRKSALVNGEICSAIEKKDKQKAMELLQSSSSDVTLPHFHLNRQLIHKAAQYGMAEVISELLKKGGNPNAIDDGLRTPLHDLADSDQLNIESVQVLLDKGAKVNLHNKDNQTPLFCMRGFGVDNHHFAIRCQFIRLMVEHGARLSGKEGKELFGEVLAAKENALAKLLMQNGIDVSDGLFQAVAGKNWEMVKYFLANGHKIQTNAKSLLKILCDTRGPQESPESIALAKQCLQYITNDEIDQPLDEVKNTYLIICAINNTPLLAGLLIDHGANMEQQTKRSSTALERAITYKKIEVVEVLINRGADLSDGAEYLYSAISNKQPKIAKLLLEKNVNPNIAYNNKTPLQVAIENKSIPLVELLLQHKTNPNLKGDEGDYPLVMAIKSGNCEIIHQLLLQGADTSLEIKKKTTIADLGKASKKDGVAELFNLSPAELKQYKPKKDGLIFTNKRMLFALGADQWTDVIKAQVQKVFGKKTPEKIQEGDLDGGDIEYVDVLDAETKKGLYQIMTFPYGDGCLLAWDKTTVVGNIIQHGFELAKAMNEEKENQLRNMLDDANREYGGLEQGIGFSES